ncbi:MAG TPA: hypothetical protein DET40_20005 [Lentisphaeria bacterium]|nr:MAG: hypothetical protein A2X45_24195 [Lentisphaerae bacterium GWF2_50_93]HCE45835.1 hypothetical protein [Lentisphaeria bacterium]
MPIESADKSLLTKTREMMFLLGGMMIATGISSALLNLFGDNWKFLIWIDEWGASTGWIIRLAAIAVGGVLLVSGRVPSVDKASKAPMKTREVDGRIVGMLGRELYIKKPRIWVRFGVVILMLALMIPTSAIIAIIILTDTTREFLIYSSIWFLILSVVGAFSVQVLRRKFGCCENGVYFCTLFSRRELLYTEIDNASFGAIEQDVNNCPMTVVTVSFVPNHSCDKPGISFSWKVMIGDEEKEFGEIRNHVADFVEDVESW